MPDLLYEPELVIADGDSFIAIEDYSTYTECVSATGDTPEEAAQNYDQAMREKLAAPPEPKCPHCKQTIDILHTKVIPNFPPEHPEAPGDPVVGYFCPNPGCNALLAVGMNY